MPEKRNMPQTFPHRVIFVASVTLCFCALGGILIAALSWIHHVWGYYISTGFWSGGVILLAGIFGIVASYVRNTCSVKTFLILAIFGSFVSLAMIALSCGGLDPDSNFYGGRPKTTLLHYICHGSYLGIGCLQLAICILSDAICIYYLFEERHAEIYTIKLRGKGKPLKRSRPKSKDSTRESTASSAPLVSSGSTKYNLDSRNSKKRKTIEVPVAEDDESDMPIIRNRGSFVKSQNGFDMSTPIRTPCIRPASFTTFGHGHGDGSERTSLLAYPDDSTSAPDTSRSYFVDTDSSPYAQTPLFCPPVPIEEDEELPPYIHQQYSPTYMQEVHNPQYRSSFLVKRPNSAHIQANRRNYLSNSQVLPHNAAIVEPFPVQTQTTPENEQNEFSKYIIDRPDLSTRLSQSEDTINKNFINKETNSIKQERPQNAQTRHSSSSHDKLSDSDKTVRDFRAHSFTDPRLNRQRRARSVELRPNKGQYVVSDNGYHGGDNKTLPTKLSGRTRTIDGKSRKEVRSLSSLPTFSPPTKPPRTHSVTLEDLLETIDNLPEESAKEALARALNKQHEVKTNAVKQDKAIVINPLQAELMNDLNKHLSQKKKIHDYATLEEMNQIKSDGSRIKPEAKGATTRTTKPTTISNFTTHQPPPEVTLVKHVNKVVHPVQPVTVEEDEVFLAPRVETKDLKAMNSSPRKTELKEKNNNTIIAPKMEKIKIDFRKSSPPEIVTVSLPTQKSEYVKEQNTVTHKERPESRDGRSSKSSQSDVEVMFLPTSPVIIQPPTSKRTRSAVEETNKVSSASITYPEIVTVDLRNKTEKVEPTSSIHGKKDRKPPNVKPKPQVYRLSTDTANIIDKNVSRISGDRAKSMELSKDTRTSTASLFTHSKRASDSNVGSVSVPKPASEKIIQKKMDHPVIEVYPLKSSTSYPTRNLFLPTDEHSGARPKTSGYRRSNSEDPDERPIRPLVRDDKQRPSSFHTSKLVQAESPSSLPQPYHSRPKFSFAYPTSPTSPVSPSRSPFTSDNRNISSPTDNKIHKYSLNSTDTVSCANNEASNLVSGTSSNMRTNATTVATAPSQSVVAPSQYQRQVAVNSHTVPSAAAAQPQPQHVPVQDQNEDPEGEKPLFSVVL